MIGPDDDRRGCHGRVCVDVRMNVARPWMAWIATALALLLALPAAAGVIELPTEAGELALSPYVTYHHDIEGTANVDDAWRQLAAGDFVPLPGGNPAFGFQSGAFWVHAKVVNRNPDEPRWLMVQSYPLSDHLDVYLRYPDGRIDHQIGGDTLPFGQRAIRYRHPNFLLELPVDQPVD